jgi:hypothetical protein
MTNITAFRTRSAINSGLTELPAPESPETDAARTASPCGPTTALLVPGAELVQTQEPGMMVSGQILPPDENNPSCISMN